MPTPAITPSSPISWYWGHYNISLCRLWLFYSYLLCPLLPSPPPPPSPGTGDIPTSPSADCRCSILTCCAHYCRHPLLPHLLLLGTLQHLPLQIVAVLFLPVVPTTAITPSSPISWYWGHYNISLCRLPLFYSYLLCPLLPSPPPPPSPGTGDITTSPSADCRCSIR